MHSVLILMDLSAMMFSKGKGVTEEGDETRTEETFQSAGKTYRSFQ